MPKSSILADASCRDRRWILDYHECEGMESLVRVLNEIVTSGFLLDRIIPQADCSFVVLFRRNDFG